MARQKKTLCKTFAQLYKYFDFTKKIGAPILVELDLRKSWPYLFYIIFGESLNRALREREFFRTIKSSRTITAKAILPSVLNLEITKRGASVGNNKSDQETTAC